MNPKLQLVLRYIITLLILAVLLGFIHHYIYSSLLKEVELFYPLWKIYAFLAFLSLSAYAFVVLTYYLLEEYTGFAFLGGVIIKMFISLVFLFPLIKSEFTDKVPDVLNFFLPFFIFLAIEAWFSVRLLQLKKTL